MPASLATEHDLSALRDGLARAIDALATAATTPPAVQREVADLLAALARDDDPPGAAINPWVWIRVQRAALRAQGVLHDRDPGRRRELRIALEQMRFLVARLEERAPLGDDRSADEVARRLDELLDGVPQARRAALVGVSTRTWQRWVSEAPTTPSPDDARRLRLVARLVAQLRHTRDAAAAAEWFATPRTALDGAAPEDLLDDPSAVEALVTAAAGSRGHVAA